MSLFLNLTLFNLAASIMVFFGLYLFHADKNSFNFKNQALYQGFVFLVAEFFALFIDSPDIQKTLMVAFVAAAAIAVEKYAKKKQASADPLMSLKGGIPAGKKPDDELPILVGVAGIFTLAFLFVVATLAKWSAMSGWMMAGIIVTIAYLAFSWRVMIVNWKDPRLDYWRWITILLGIAGIILVLANRADILERAQVLFDAAQNSGVVQ